MGVNHGVLAWQFLQDVAVGVNRGVLAWQFLQGAVDVAIHGISIRKPEQARLGCAMHRAVLVGLPTNGILASPGERI